MTDQRLDAARTLAMFANAEAIQALAGALSTDTTSCPTN